MAFGGQAFGQRARADQTYFLARGPDEGDVAVFERDRSPRLDDLPSASCRGLGSPVIPSTWGPLLQRPNGGDQRGVADAVIEAAAIGAGAEKRAILLGNGNRIADFDTEFGDFLGAACANVHADRVFGFSWPFEILLVPAARQFHDCVAIARRRMDEHGMAFVET